MKRLFVFFCIFSTLSCVSAQVRFGIKGGVNLTNAGFQNQYSYEAINSKMGFYIGPTALYQTPLKRLSLDASLMYDQRGVETKGDFLGGHRYFTTTTQRQIVVPVHARYVLLGGKTSSLFAFAGPRLGLNIGKEQALDFGDMVFSPASFSIDVGIGLMLSRHLQVSADYNVICGKSAGVWINRQWGFGKQVNRCRMNAWQFSLGYYF